VPDRDGKLENVNLGFPDLASYERETDAYFGRSVGRFCNRIGGGTFELAGRRQQVSCNLGADHLHGGLVGFSRRVWKGAAFASEDRAGATFSLVSDDGDQGFPGRLHVQATYALTAAGELVAEFRAHADAPTVVNLTNHNYWNLDPAHSDARSHVLALPNAAFFLPVDARIVPTGEVRAVADTPLDLRAPTALSTPIDALRALDAAHGGLDHCFVLAGAPRDPASGLRVAAELYHPRSGRRMRVLTSQPALQVYTGNFLDGRYADAARAGPHAAGAQAYAQYGALCLGARAGGGAPRA
jgi:aldose 1-epimerase